MLIIRSASDKLAGQAFLVGEHKSVHIGMV